MSHAAPSDFDPNHNPWQVLSTDLKYQNPWITVREDQVLNPSGGPGIYGVVSMKNKAIGIVPLDAEGNRKPMWQALANAFAARGRG